ncbi:hypothetical protein ACFL5Q_00875 [Planctomycetota bacterium]
MISDPEPGQIQCHWCGGNGRKHGVVAELCEWCEGRGYRHPQHEVAQQEGGPFVFFVEAGKPRTAHVTLLSILSPLDGEVRICDPYYGTGTLLRLDPIADKPIRFLTRQPDSKEQSSGILSKAVAEFFKQHPNVEFKRHSTRDLHDRFILCRTELILLGHGLKDIGNKDSFIVRLSRDIAADTIDEVTDSFDRKWANAEKLT